MIVTLVTLTLLCAPPPQAGVLILKPAKVMRHLRQAVQSQDKKQIDRAVRALIVIGNKGRRNLRRQVRRHRSPLFVHVLRAISQMHPKTRLLALPLLRSKDPQLRIHGAQTLNGSNFKLLKASFEKERTVDVQVALLASMAESDAEGSSEFLVASLSSKIQRVRIQALACLLLRRERTALSTVHALLFDPDAEVRAATVRFLSVLGTRGSVKAMVERTKTETDKDLLGAIWSALESLTGESFGRDLKAWQRWLNSET